MALVNRLLLAMGTCMGITLMSGCDSLSDARGASSLFDIGAPVSPEQAAQMSINQFNADERARGTLLLANSWFGGEPIYMELYQDNINDWDAGVRMASVRALGNHGSPEHAPLIIERLNDEDERVRLEAARALQRLHSPDAVEPLLSRIVEPAIMAESGDRGESDPRVRAEAANALGQYAEPRVIEGLIRSLDDRQLAVNMASRQSLQTLTGQDFGQDRAEWLTWYEQVDDPFRGRTAYMFPVFERGRRLIEFLPLTAPPPNEVASTPTGMPPVRRSRPQTNPDNPSDLTGSTSSPVDLGDTPPPASPSGTPSMVTPQGDE
jgi:hypothetical protein